MKRQIVVGLVAAAAAAAAVLERPWGTAQAQQAGDTPQTMPSLADIMSGTQWRHLKLAYSGMSPIGSSPTTSSAKFNTAFPRRRSSIPRSRAFRWRSSLRTRVAPPCRSRQSDREEEQRGFHQSVREAHGCVQSLPSGGGDKFHRHTHSDVLPIQQSAISARPTVRLDASGVRRP